MNEINATNSLGNTQPSFYHVICLELITWIIIIFKCLKVGQWYSLSTFVSNKELYEGN